MVLNRGYSILAIHKELQKSVCPLCKKGNFKDKPSLIFRNCGFVNCEWVMRGILKSNTKSKIYADGRTYDNKLYTFKEIDYREVWLELDIIVQKIDDKHNWKNIQADPNKNENKNLDSSGFELFNMPNEINQ